MELLKKHRKDDDMELHAFAGIVCEGIQQRMGQEYDISVVTNVKNNSTEETGILFRKEEEDISPAVYIDDLFGEYCEKGTEVEDVVQEVIERYEKSLHTFDELHDLKLDWELCQKRIIYRLVSRERNEQMLRTVPYIPFLDMAITFHVVAGISKTYVQTIKIDKELQKRWGVSVEQLFKFAEQNTEKLLPLELYDMDKLALESVLTKEECIAKDEKTDMIVATNCLGIYGASVILYRGMMDELAQEEGYDLYVVPSSVHEMILIPAKDEAVYKCLSSMIREVNKQFVSSNEVLSDQAYIYLKEERKFVTRDVR